MRNLHCIASFKRKWISEADPDTFIKGAGRIGNILLKHVFTSLQLSFKKKGGWGPSPCHPLFGSAYGY
jgi:hypothetical protein